MVQLTNTGPEQVHLDLEQLVGMEGDAGDAVVLLWSLVIKAAPTEALVGFRNEPERNGWLYGLVNEMKTDVGSMLWEAVCSEMDRREAADKA